MTQQEKIGTGIIIALFAIFGIVLYFTVTPPSGTSGSFENNVIIEQRIRNLNK